MSDLSAEIRKTTSGKDATCPFDLNIYGTCNFYSVTSSWPTITIANQSPDDNPSFVPEYGSGAEEHV